MSEPPPPPPPRLRYVSIVKTARDGTKQNDKQKSTPLSEVNYFTKNPERAARMDNWSGIIGRFQKGLEGMPDEDKMRLPGTWS